MDTEAENEFEMETGENERPVVNREPTDIEVERQQLYNTREKCLQVLENNFERIMNNEFLDLLSSAELVVRRRRIWGLF